MVEQSFDPYRKWLGIPGDEQPPNHYRLLGIARFEDDPDVISSAADRQMAHVRTFQTGRRSAESQRILNQLSAVRLCLLSDDKKEEYDDSLRLTSQSANSNSGGGSAGTSSPPPPSPPPVAAVRSVKPRPTGPRRVGVVAAVAKPVAATSAIAAVGSGPRIIAKRKTTRRKSSALPMIFGTLGGGIVLLLLMLFLSGTLDGDPKPTGNRSSRNAIAKKKTTRRPGRDDDATARNGRSSSKPPRDRSQHSKQPSDDNGPVQTTPTTSDPNDKPADDHSLFGESNDTPPNDPSANDDDPKQPADPDRVAPFDPDGTGQDEGKSNDDEQSAPARLPAPSRKALEIAIARVRADFWQEYEDSPSPDDRSELAAKIFDLAKQTSDDPVTRFALLSVAIEVSVPIVKIKQFCEIIDTMAMFYDINGLERKRKGIEQASKAAADPRQHQSILQHSRVLVHQAIAADKIELADAFARLSKVAAAKTGNLPDRALATQLIREVSDLKKLQKAVARSKRILADKPEDPGANAVLGRYYCFTKLDWKQGLPMLAKSDDTRYRDLAQQDLSGPKDPQLRTKIAESWLALADRKNDPHQRAYRLRAREWFRGAAEALSDANEKNALRAKITEIDILVGDR